MSRDNIKQDVNIFIEHVRNGEVIAKYAYHNVTTNTGKAGLAARMGTATNAVTYIGIGTGTTAEAATDTTLQTEITTGGGARAAATVSIVTTTVSNDTLQLLKTYTFSSSFSVSETASFDAATSGIMYNRKTFTAIPVVSGDQLTLIHQFKIS